jgi:hypothetical protein
MSDTFRRLLTMSPPDALSLNAQAALGPLRQPERSQFALLVRHFLERFFNHETASPDGDAKTHMVQIACAASLPGFIFSLYLWPLYHPLFGWPTSPPSYWVQVNHHLFFIVYSFVAMGIATVFEWDMFFPDLLDIFVLTTLPVPDRRLFMARIAAILVFIFGFLFDANLLALLLFPIVVDPPNIARILAGHLLAVAGSGFFAAAFVLALQGMLLSLLGERVFRRISLLLQGLLITALLMMLLLFPVISSMVAASLKAGSVFAFCFPPFWFLGIYQCLIEGASALPIHARLAKIGCAALLTVSGFVLLTYPTAYLRRMRQLMEGSGTRDTRNRVALPLHKLLHLTFLRSPIRRAVFHFISQTLLRVQRYRIYLVICGGAGFSLVIAVILRVEVVQNRIGIVFSADGLRAAIGIIAFWVITGLRMAFVSPGNQQGSWAFRIVHGRPPRFDSAIEQLQAAKTWVCLWGVTITFSFSFAFRAIAPPELLTWSVTESQLLTAAGMSLLLTDILFFNVKTVPFAGVPTGEESNLAVTVLKYFVFVPVAACIPLIFEPWVENGFIYFILAAAFIAIAHLAIGNRHRALIQEYCSMPELEDGEEEFPIKLGLRY